MISRDCRMKNEKWKMENYMEPIPSSGNFQFSIFNFSFDMCGLRQNRKPPSRAIWSLQAPVNLQFVANGFPQKMQLLAKSVCGAALAPLSRQDTVKVSTHGRSVVATTLFAENCVCEASAFKTGDRAEAGVRQMRKKLSQRNGLVWDRAKKKSALQKCNGYCKNAMQKCHSVLNCGAMVLCGIRFTKSLEMGRQLLGCPVGCHNLMKALEILLNHAKPVEEGANCA